MGQVWGVINIIYLFQIEMSLKICFLNWGEIFGLWNQTFIVIQFSLVNYFISKYQGKGLLWYSSFLTPWMKSILCGLPDSFPSRRMVCWFMGCSWMRVAGMTQTWLLRTRCLEWWTPCCLWCISNLSKTMFLSPAYTTHLCTRPPFVLELCQLQVFCFCFTCSELHLVSSLNSYPVLITE